MRNRRRVKPYRFKKSIKQDEVRPDTDTSNDTLSNQLSHNEQSLRKVFSQCSDVVFRPFQVSEEIQMMFIYVDGLVDTATLDQAVLMPMLYQGVPQGLSAMEWVGKLVENQLIAIAQTMIIVQTSILIEKIMNGNIALLMDGEVSALALDLKGFSKRSIDEPASEQLIRGPREGFIEDIRTNTSLLRRKLKNARMKFEPLVLGEVSHTDIVIAYVEGIVNEAVLQEVRERMTRIEIDAALDSGYIEEFIEDVWWSPFPTIQNTERPDVVIASLLEGKVAILIDGSPFVLLVPFTFWGALQSAEDYYERYIYTTAIRWLRFILMGSSLLLPSIYVALTTFNPQLLPTNLILTFAAAREPSPFPTVVEALLMELTFEALREAGIRLPKAVGSAVSIVGALVIGQAAVDAGIVTAPLVIVVAATGIASFSIPRYNFSTALRLLRFPMLFLSGTLGFFGITIGLMMILSHLVSIQSFGVPYFEPLAPTVGKGLNDSLWRSPRWLMNARPQLISGKRSIRIPPNQKPSPNRKK